MLKWIACFTRGASAEKWQLQIDSIARAIAAHRCLRLRVAKSVCLFRFISPARDSSSSATTLDEPTVAFGTIATNCNGNTHTNALLKTDYNLRAYSRDFGEYSPPTDGRRQRRFLIIFNASGICICLHRRVCTVYSTTNTPSVCVCVAFSHTHFVSAVRTAVQHTTSTQQYSPNPVAVVARLPRAHTHADKAHTTRRIQHFEQVPLYAAIDALKSSTRRIETSRIASANWFTPSRK